MAVSRSFGLFGGDDGSSLTIASFTTMQSKTPVSIGSSLTAEQTLQVTIQVTIRLLLEIDPLDTFKILSGHLLAL
jgi:hypothetical protein